jgi:hypothetical protein
VLTDRERRVLDEIAADMEQSDPRLAARLAGRHAHVLLGRLRRSKSVTAGVAIPAGLALTVATFPVSAFAGFAGVAVAFWGCTVHADGTAATARALSRRVRTRAERDQ